MIIKKINNKHDGGAEGTRTPDLLTASQALSQLSYSPTDSRQLSYKIGLFPSRFPQPNLRYEIGCLPQEKIYQKLFCLLAGRAIK